MNKKILGMLHAVLLGAFGSAIITEITVEGNVVWGNFLTAKSIVITLIYIIVIYLLSRANKKVKTFSKEWTQQLEKIDYIEKVTKKNNDSNLPKVLMANKKTTGEVLLILTSSPFFAYDTLVSIYTYIDEHEEFVAVGKVSNIQEDKKIQVTITNFSKERNELITKIANSNNTLLKKLIIKPNVPQMYLELLDKEGE
ncbi:hypothetical protein PDL07_12095 [Bacillus cereus]|uniref:hypothetical protein n=1 Tax=Bacillus cereus TaxID=1396 RepID=UPI002AC2A4D3|nr:hypothetical protein [Bacillus cereus]MDA1783423.1 hypothetical protein [Bacillus cereus]MDZ4538556.1 hypothetical protein [Bacillus cereus]